MFIEAKNDGGGGDNWNYKSCKAPVKSSPPTNQHPFFLQAECPSCHQTNSVKALKGKNITFHGLAYPKLTWGLPTLSLTTSSSWLPLGEAMPLISPLMPVPHVNALLMGYILFSTFHARTNRYHSSFGVGLTDLFFTATSSHVLKKKSINEVVEMEFPSLRSLDQQHQVTVRIKWNMNRTWRCAQTHFGSLSDSDLVKCWAATPQHRTWVAWPTTGFLQFREMKTAKQWQSA